MPYMRVTRSTFDPATSADDLTGLGQALTAAFQQLPGIQHIHGGIDREGGRGITVLIFDTQEHAQFAPEALGAANARVQSLGLQIASREVYEVTV
ncbi:MAG: hypothetical protein ACTHMJ_06960 [Thermomicrobiales bacterium]